MAKEHEKYLVSFLDRNKAKSYIGSELSKILISKFNELSEENARKVISNCYKKKLILSTKPITFQNNQYAYFSSNAVINYFLFKHNIEQYKPHLFRVIFALKRKSGIISLNEFCNISGVSLNGSDHDVSFDRLINDLNGLDIAELFEINDLKCICFKNKELLQERANALPSELKDKNLLLSVCATWLTRSNIVDSKQFCFLGKPNNYEGINRNNIYWDAFGFTNTIGLGGTQKDYQTIAVIDFQHAVKYEEYDFEGFKKRVERLIFSVKHEKRKVLPIIVALDFSPAAMSLIKKNNYMCFNISTILGKNALSISRHYRESIEDLDDKISKKDFSQMTNNISSMCNFIRANGNEVNYGNLKGTLFEYLMYPILSRIFNKQGDRITHNFKRKVSGEEFECDYRIETVDENIFIELKGYEKNYVIPMGNYDKNKGDIDHQSIKWFLTHTYELAKQCVGIERECKFCYITTAQIEDIAKEKMTQRKKDKPNLLQHFYEHDSLIQLLRDYRFENEIKVIEQFYS